MGITVTTELLVPLEVYLTAGIHIGTRIRTGPMAPFIYKVRPDGLSILDINKTDLRIRVAAKLISSFQPDNIVAASARLYGQVPVQKFAMVTGAVPITGRFIPGTFTNPLLKTYVEPEIVIVVDPEADKQVLEEASRVGIPTISLCDSENMPEFVDLIIPCNNKGRKALALIFWLLARQVLRERGTIPVTGDLQVPIDEFETKVALSSKEE
ncbi:MAG: 30S ribosomal protein S2 [Candidatus Methanomethylicia archaeon]